MTPSQLSALKSAINANPTWAAFPMNGDGYYDLAIELNKTASPDFVVWKTNTKASDIIDAITLSSYTPNDSVSDALSDIELQRRIGRVLYAQTKQMNLQLMIQGRDYLDTSKVTIRTGLRDCVIGLPTGTNGASTSPGGANGATVLNVCTRLATYAEKALATPSQASDTTGVVTARVMGYEGFVTAQDVQQARELA